MIESDINTILTALMALILAVIAWYNKQRTATAATIATATTQTAISNSAMASIPQALPLTTPVFDPGFTVYPASLIVKSGQTAGLNIKAGLAAISCTVVWGDGVSTTTPIRGEVSLSHVYNYISDGKYTGHQFYPVFTIKDAYGQTRTFNDVSAGQGACCAIEVQAN